jgi:hypothetical protein
MRSMLLFGYIMLYGLMFVGRQMPNTKEQERDGKDGTFRAVWIVIESILSLFVLTVIVVVNLYFIGTYY